MDKLMDHPWFIRVVSLLLAIMLYMSANVGAKTGETRNTFGQEDTETLIDIPVVAYYDEDNLVVSGVPKYVNVTLQGPASIVKPTALQRNFEVYVDLTDLPLGTYTVPIKYRDISDKLKVTIQPSSAKVTIREKVSKRFPVGVEFFNRNKMPDGYSVGEPTVKPVAVTITGAKELIDEIAFVKAIVDLDGATETLTREARVRVYDRRGNELDIEPEPSSVEVTVPVKSPSKTVSVQVRTTGELPDGVHLVSITPEPDRVTIYGPKDVLNRIDKLEGLTVDLDDITDDSTIELNVPLPDGAKSVNPDKIKVHIDVEKDVTQTWKDVPIAVVGLPDSYKAEFVKPLEGKITVRLVGPPDVVRGLTKDDVRLYVDVSGLGIGEHQVPIQWNHPEQVQWQPSAETAMVHISDKATAQ
ncbi:putative secreted protein associated with spyDAC [Geobacillus proteiniphilus]|uniref:Putative secreted protein associated with spyDAC n=1 Tax=Geobacillus proteiniphilus TaxID=860353 RepID=A0A1Q5SK59_9BACL|nr:CdaR family protein [Geobacillus proteiniphilus]OKO88399.1 putative secreted protein associated with spyDAC [Geobacillus proteiniphilus]